MAGSAPQHASDGHGTHLVLYDGMCGLCSSLVQFVLTRDRRGVLAFAPLQGATGRAVVGRLGGDPTEMTSFFVVENYRTGQSRLLARSRAALFVAGQLGWPWRAAVVARVLPCALLDRIYNVVARNRYRVFGRFEQCLAPGPEFRSSFVE